MKNNNSNINIIFNEIEGFEFLYKPIQGLRENISIEKSTKETLYNFIKTNPDSIIISNDKSILEFIDILNDPKAVSQTYLKHLIILFHQIAAIKELQENLPYTVILLIPVIDDPKALIHLIITNVKLLISSIENRYLENRIELLELEIEKVKIENEKQLKEIENYLSDLELKSLMFEREKDKAEKELQLRLLYEKEITTLNETLQEYSLKLNELIKELKTFNYTISHDLKAPLRGIAGYFKELINDYFPDYSKIERASFCVNQIRRSIENMSKMIDDLLNYSKLEFDTPTKTTCNLENIINYIINERKHVIQKYNAAIEIDLQVKQIYSWERGLMQVFSNLIDNAIKYSKIRETPLIKISSKQIDKNILIIVADNGIGFDMIYAEKIFQLFKRATNNPEYEGTGAGLAIVSKIIEKIKGKIWAESEPDKGSKFFIQFPIE